MSGKKRSLVFGLIGVVLSIIVWFIFQMNRASMIVNLGVIGANRLQAVVMFIIVPVSLFFIVLGLPGLIRGMKSRMDKRRNDDIGQRFRSKGSGPEEIREQLGLMMEQRPELQGKIYRCISQLSEIADQLSRFDRLIKINEAISLAAAREAFEETQSTICHNLKWVINSSIAVSTSDKQFNDRLDENIEKALGYNEKLLEKDDEFLLDIADRLSQVKDEEQAIQLEAWCKTISSLNQQSIMR